MLAVDPMGGISFGAKPPSGHDFTVVELMPPMLVGLNQKQLAQSGIIQLLLRIALCELSFSNKFGLNCT